MSRKARHLPSPGSDAGSAQAAPDRRWRALFNSEPPRSASLVAQAIAWREQVEAHGDVAPAIERDLAAAARQARVARGAMEPAPTDRSAAPVTVASSRTRRAALATLPPASSQLHPGTRLVKSYGGRTHVVEVTATGMLYEGQLYASLSAVAKAITGTHWNGLLFFGLRQRKTYPAKARAHG